MSRLYPIRKNNQKGKKNEQKNNKKYYRCIVSNNALGATYGVNGMSNFYANKGRDGLNVFVEASFTPGVKTNTTKYGLIKGKYVRKVTINLKEGTSYNKSKSTTTGNLIRLSKRNNPLQKSYGSWRWTYK